MCSWLKKRILKTGNWYKISENIIYCDAKKYGISIGYTGVDFYKTGIMMKNVNSLFTYLLGSEIKCNSYYKVHDTE